MHRYGANGGKYKHFSLELHNLSKNVRHIIQFYVQYQKN